MRHRNPLSHSINFSLRWASSLGLRLSIDICYWRRGAKQQTHRPPATAAAVDRRNRQTGGQTDTRPLHWACSACYAGSVNKMLRPGVWPLLVRRHWRPDIIDDRAACWKSNGATKYEVWRPGTEQQWKHSKSFSWQDYTSSNTLTCK